MERELDEFLAQPPPRQLTPGIRRTLGSWKGSRTLLIFGALFGTFGLLFCFVFLPWRWPLEWWLERGDPIVVPGQVASVTKTRMSINQVRVWRVEVAYRDLGEERRSVGYTTGSKFSPGAEAMVRVHRDDPDLNCPEGARMSEGSMFTAFVLVFPAAGFGLVAGAVVSRARRMRILERGIRARAMIASMKKTRSSMNDHPVHEATLRIDGIPEPVRIRRHNPEEVRCLREGMEAGTALTVMFDPGKPKRLVIPDAWLEVR